MYLEINKDGLKLDGKEFYLASGDMHYFRFLKAGWKRRLQLMKDFGLTAVQTYVPWNMHEPEEGEFHFEDNLDIAAFLKLCDDMGLKVMFRPSPYICSEWDWGGLPYWLMKKPGLCIRTTDEQYMMCVRRYYERLSREFLPYLSTNGGPIIAVAVENEYGSFGDDKQYIKAVGNLLTEIGVDVPLFTANGAEPFKMIAGSRKEYWTGVDLHALTPEIKEACKKYQPDKPIYIGEFWGGRSQQWGFRFARQTAEEVAEKYRLLLEEGAYVNFYMFCGGTNFGFQNGALEGKNADGGSAASNRYIPFATSYDVDALVTEYGAPTEKYEACKQVLKSYLEKRHIPHTATPVIQYEHKAQTISQVALPVSADLLDNREVLAAGIKRSGSPLTMEMMNQAYGFILYTTHVDYTDELVRELRICGLHDRATVYGNGDYLGSCMRDREDTPIRFKVPEDGLTLDILVESLGRINYGQEMLFDHKGICKYVRLELVDENGEIYPWNYTIKTGWTNYSLPLKNLSGLDVSKKAKPDRPAFFSGSFRAKPHIDTFLDMRGWKKGTVWINGFSLGRYWDIGPQGTLYVPGELLQSDNTICVLELHRPNDSRTVSFVDTPMLDTISK